MFDFQFFCEVLGRYNTFSEQLISQIFLQDKYFVKYLQKIVLFFKGVLFYESGVLV